MLITLFLVLAAALGTAYAYMHSKSSPYGAHMNEYLGDQFETTDETAARA